MSLRTRIALAAAVAVAAVALGLGTIGYLANRTKLIDQIHQQLTERVQTLLSANQQGDRYRNVAPDGGDRLGRCRSFDSIHPDSPDLGGAPGYFQFVCSDGQIAAQQGGTDLPVTQRVLAVARQGQRSLLSSAYVQRAHVEILTIGDQQRGRAIEVALPLAGVDSTLHSLLVTYLVLGGIGALLAGVTGLIIGRAAVAPIRRLSEKTESVTTSLHLPRRLEESGAEELRRLAVSFNQTLAALERSVDAQRQLIADASHELRTPIAALRSDVQIFLDADRLPADERTGLQTSILGELDDLTQLVSDVLELARGSGPADYIEPVELDGVVRDAVNRTLRRAPGMSFAVDLDPTVIVNNPDRVSRAVLNVIDNARKWSPPHGVVEVSLHAGTLVVRDHGPGFDNEDLGHLFDRFYRSPDARRMPGSGLGLAIVKQAAEAHGGFAQALNATDGGAVIRLGFGTPTPSST